MQTCYRHPSRETGVSCSNCGRPICTDCMTTTQVGMRCPECAADRTQVRSMGSLASEPTATYVLIAINVLVFIAQTATAGSLSSTGGEIFQQGATFGPLVAHGQWWRLVTGGFLHANLIHIGFNMYLLYALGTQLEQALGRARFLVIYFGSLLCGSLGVMLLEPTSPAIGASGAIFGLFAAAAVGLHRQGINPFKTGIGALIILNLVITFAVPDIAIGAHIGGLLGGGLIGWIVLELRDRSRSIVAPVAIGSAITVVAAVLAVIAAGAAT